MQYLTCTLPASRPAPLELMSHFFYAVKENCSTQISSRLSPAKLYSVNAKYIHILLCLKVYCNNTLSSEKPCELHLKEQGLQHHAQALLCSAVPGFGLLLCTEHIAWAAMFVLLGTFGGHKAGRGLGKCCHQCPVREWKLLCFELFCSITWSIFVESSSSQTVP